MLQIVKYITRLKVGTYICSIHFASLYIQPFACRICMCLMPSFEFLSPTVNPSSTTTGIVIPVVYILQIKKPMVLRTSIQSCITP
jgi:hypothetical protein